MNRPLICALLLSAALAAAEPPVVPLWATGVGVVVAPGGAHQYPAVGIEGEEIAHRVIGYAGGKVAPKLITNQTPPSCLVFAAADRGPTANNLALFAAPTEAGVPAEILTWPVSQWPNQLLASLADLGILKR